MTVKDELPWLDWLRFLAAFVVLLSHARQMTFSAYGDLIPSQNTLLTQVFFAVTRPGREAVLMFFVLSGFLVGGKMIERVRAGNLDLKTYSIDRLTRLYVPLVPALALSVVVGFLWGPQSSPTTLLGNLLNLQGLATPLLETNGPLWSLAYEWWFYVIAGGMGALVVGARKNLALCIVFLGFGLVCAGAPEFILCWASGALAYLWRPKRVHWATVISTILVVAFGILQIQFGKSGVASSSTIAFLPLPVAHILFSCAFALLIPQIITIAAPEKGWLNKFYSIGTPLAAFSYTLYLTHYPVLWAFLRVWPQSDAVNAVSVVAYLARVLACLLVALIMYHLFEKHTPKVRGWVKSYVGSSRAPVAQI